MKLIYLGAEVPSNRHLLNHQGVVRYGWSYLRAKSRGFPKTKVYTFSDYFESGSQIMVHPGIHEATGDIQELAADYQDFIVTHLDEIDSFVEFDHPSLPADWLERQRQFWEQAGRKFWPIWNPERGVRDLHTLSDRFSDVCVPNIGAFNMPAHQVLGQIRGLASRGTTFHGMGIASPEDLRQVPFTTASSLSWASPMRHGETIVWDGNRLVRYPKSMKSQARPRYRSVIVKAGLDYDKIMADDAKEITRLAIWSYQRMEESMDKKNPTRPGNNPFRVIEGEGRADDDAVTEIMLSTFDGEWPEDLDNTPTGMRQAGTVVPAPRTASEQRFLPTFGVESKTIVEQGEDGRDVLREVPVLSSNSTSMRQCDTCFVASNCPAYKPQSECAFSLPVEVRTRDQLKSLLNAVIEMQGARVAFAKFSEDLNGGYPDPNTSLEIDRLFKLVESMKRLEENKEYMRITMERQGSAGVLSSIFGDRAQVLKELENGGMNENQTNLIIQGALGDE